MNDANEFRAIDRFRVIRRVGAGGSGVVYEAYDREQGARVALKTLFLPSAEALLRFKNEFRSLQDLHHPNLVSLGELFESSGSWFFSMEFVEGIDLVRFTDPKDPSQVRRTFAQLFRGLAALHAAGKVHRDIKPSNVLVTAEGRVIILDFGLIADVASTHLQENKDVVVGTLHYMAPEQAVHQPIDARTDLYSAGVVLYRALTGKLPYERVRERELINVGRREKPTPPSQVVLGIPSDLSDLCMDLLQVSQELRPSAEEAAARLDQSGVTYSMSPPLPSFVGRDAELAFLRDAFNETLFGSSVAFAVSGDSGVGKSALVRHFGERVRAETGAVVLSGRCYERESVPYKGIDGVIDSMCLWLLRLPSAERNALLPPRARILAHVFPVLKQIENFTKNEGDQDFPADPKALRAQVFSTVRDLFVRMAERLPVVLIIDDLQWSDADSLALLRSLLRPPDAPGLLLLATVRKTSESAPDPLRDLPGDVRALRLASLPEKQARELATVLLRRVPWSREHTVEDIAREASGHPLYIDELVRHAMLEEGGPALGARLEDSLWARIERLEPAARRLVELCAIAGAPRSQEVLAHAANLEFAQLARVMATLRAANLVRTSGLRRIDTGDVYHDRIRAAVLAHLDEDAEVLGHRRLAEAIAERSPDAADALAVHWLGAKEPTKAGRYAVLAAGQAKESLAFDRAIALYRMALSVGDNSESERRSIRARLADALADGGRGAEAADMYMEAAIGASDSDVMDLQGRTAEQLLVSGRFEEGRAMLKKVLSAMGMEMARSRSSAIASLLFHRGQLLARGLRFEPKSESEIDPNELRGIDLLGSAAMALGVIDALEGAGLQTRHLLKALAAGEPKRVARALALEAVYSAAGGTKNAARTTQIVTYARAVADSAGNPLAVARGLAAAGTGAFLEGRWSDANSFLERSLTILRAKTSGASWEVNTAQFYQLAALFHLGNLKELGRQVPILLSEAQQRGDRFATTQLRTGVLCVTWLARGDSILARKEADDAIVHWAKRGTHFFHFLDLLAQAQIDLYEGLPDAAYTRVLDGWPAYESSLIRRVQFVRIKMFELRARTAIALTAHSSEKRKEELLRDAERCARSLDDEGARWAIPLARILRAGIAVKRGRPEDGRDLLVRAESEFAAADMMLHVAVTQWQRAAITERSEAERARQSARSWLDGQAVKDPHKLMRMLAPL